MAYDVVLKSLFILFALIGVGFLCGKLRIVSDHASQDITGFVLKAAIPCMLFKAIVESRSDGELLLTGAYIAGFGVLALLLGNVIALLAARLLKVPEGKRGIWVFCATFSNCGFVGFPVANAIFGAQGLFLAVFFNIAYSVVLYSVGAKEVSLDSGEKGGVGWKDILLNPPNFGIVLGFVFFFIRIAVPAPVMTVISYLGETTTPLGMMLIGISISKGRFLDMVRDKHVVYVSLLRLVFMPLLVYALFKLIPLPVNPLSASVLVAMLAMPAPAISLMFAEQYKSSTEMAGQIVFLSSALSIITMPLVFLLL